MTRLLLTSGVLVAVAASVALGGCRAPAKTATIVQATDLPPCPKTKTAAFPLFPGALPDSALGGETVGAVGKRYRVTVYRLARPMFDVRNFYRRCLGEETHESDDGSYHWKRPGTALSVSGNTKGTLLRITRKPGP